MRKSIISIFLITAMAVLILPVFITRVEADTDLSAYPYKYYIVNQNNTYHLIISKKACSYEDSSLPYTSTVVDLNTGLTLDPILGGSGIKGYYQSSAGTNVEPPLLLIFNGLTWEVKLPYISSGRFIIVGNYAESSHSTTVPAGFPEVDLGEIDLNAINANTQNLIDQALNATTSTTTTANSLNNQVSQAYTNYANGTITAAALQSQLDSIKSQLQTLMNKTTNTISDRLNVQNTLTYTQIVQDVVLQDNILSELEEDLKVSSSVSTAVTGKINEANQTFQNYSQGNTTQSEAVTQINQYITYLTSLISSETPTADIEAINAGINTINGIKDSITSYSDLDSSISDSAQNSDQAELDYLEEIMSETTSTIQDMSPEKKFSSQQISSGNNILAIVWDNEIINRIIPLAACFMVVCVALGIRYKL